MKSAAAGNDHFSSTRLERIKVGMQRYVDDGRLPGLITALMHRGQLVHLQTYGCMDLEAGKSMREDTIFRIRSMTKPIATTAAMILVEERRLQLSDPVGNYIPACRSLRVGRGAGQAGLEREITIRDLMLHTSGLVFEFDYHKTLAENVQELVKQPLAFQPGERWQYGESLTLLATIVELVSGTPFNRFLAERILDPLQMQDTDYYVPHDKLQRFASLYTPTQQNGLERLETAENSVYSQWRALFSGSSGLVSTVPDYLRFAQMLLNGGELDGARILSSRTVKNMMRNHLPDRLLPLQLPGMNMAGIGFGLGGYVVRAPAPSQPAHSVGTFGWMGASSTDFWIDSQEEIVGVLMTQLDPYGSLPLLRTYKSLVYGYPEGRKGENR